MKKSFLDRSEIFGLLVNTLTANDEYCCHNNEIILLRFSNDFIEKAKTFYGFLIPFLASTLNFEQFEKKIERHSINI